MSVTTWTRSGSFIILWFSCICYWNDLYWFLWSQVCCFMKVPSCALLLIHSCPLTGLQSGRRTTFKFLITSLAIRCLIIRKWSNEYFSTITEKSHLNPRVLFSTLNSVVNPPVMMSLNKLVNIFLSISLRRLRILDLLFSCPIMIHRFHLNALLSFISLSLFLLQPWQRLLNIWNLKPVLKILFLLAFSGYWSKYPIYNKLFPGHRLCASLFETSYSAASY